MAEPREKRAPRETADARRVLNALVEVSKGAAVYEGRVEEAERYLNILVERCRSAHEDGATYAELAEITGMDVERIAGWI